MLSPVPVHYQSGSQSNLGQRIEPDIGLIAKTEDEIDGVPYDQFRHWPYQHKRKGDSE